MKITSGIFILFLFITNIYGQNIYKDYNLNDTIKGEKLTIGSGNMGYFRDSEYGSTLNLLLGINYSKWKFSPTMLYYMQANGYTNYNRTNYNDPQVSNKQSNRNDYSYNFENFLYTGIGASRYFSPKKFYLSAAISAELRTLNASYQDEISESRLIGQGFTWAGMGYGRIDNAEGLERTMTASESLLRYNIIKTKLSSKSIKEIDVKLAEFRNENYLNKFLDDESIILMKDIEAILLKNNEINGSLNAENSVRLYQILMNTSRRFFYYPRYIGTQFDVQLQTQIFSYEKPKENYLKLSGVYGYPISEKTNLLFTTSYRYSLSNDASGYVNRFPAYYSFYGNTEDYNNVQFNTPHNGLGVFSETYFSIMGHKSLFSVQAEVTHSLNSTAGLHIGAQYHYFAANSVDSNITYFYSDPTANEYYFNISAQLDYNIYSHLFSHFRTGYGKTNYRDAFSVNLDFDYVIF
jgi:hypothetical protein